MDGQAQMQWEMARRWEQYQICAKRGHTPANVTVTTDPPSLICRFCDTSYRYVDTLFELNPPTETTYPE